MSEKLIDIFDNFELFFVLLEMKIFEFAIVHRFLPEME